MVTQAVAMLDELYDAAPPQRRGIGDRVACERK
jgi:hypothetical protein